MWRITSLTILMNKRFHQLSCKSQRLLFSKKNKQEKDPVPKTTLRLTDSRRLNKTGQEATSHGKTGRSWDASWQAKGLIMSHLASVGTLLDTRSQNWCRRGRLLVKVRTGATVWPSQRASWGYPWLEQNHVLPSVHRKPARSPCDLNDEISREEAEQSQGRAWQHTEMGYV